MGKYGSFRAKSWDPVLLLTQIIAVQSSLYFTLGILMYFMDILGGLNNSLDHIFTYQVFKRIFLFQNNSNCSSCFQKIKVSDSEGRLVIFAYLINALIGSLVLLLLVKRTKLCLDFRWVSWDLLPRDPCLSCFLMNQDDFYNKLYISQDPVDN